MKKEMNLEKVKAHFEGSLIVKSIYGSTFNIPEKFKYFFDDKNIYYISYNENDYKTSHSIYNIDNKSIGDILKCKEGYILIDGRCVKDEDKQENTIGDNTAESYPTVINTYPNELQQALDKITELTDENSYLTQDNKQLRDKITAMYAIEEGQLSKIKYLEEQKETKGYRDILEQNENLNRVNDELNLRIVKLKEVANKIINEF